MVKAVSVRPGLPGESDPGEWMRRELARRQALGEDVDYADEILGPGRGPSTTVDAVSRAVALAGGSAVYWENPRPAWSRPKGKLEGEIAGEPTRFDREYRVGAVSLFVDIMKGDSIDAFVRGEDAGWAEQKRLGEMCRSNGAAYLYVDPSLDDEKIAEAVAGALAMLRKHLSRRSVAARVRKSRAKKAAKGE